LPAAAAGPLRGEAVCVMGDSDTQHAASLRGPFTPADAPVCHGRGPTGASQRRPSTIQRARGLALAPTARGRGPGCRMSFSVASPYKNRDLQEKYLLRPL
jgi:hypothetical protein